MPLKKQSQMKNIKKNILKYFIEFLIVAFGVFLGMYVSEWNSDRKLKDTKDKSITYIYKELESNRVNLLKNITYHEMIKVGFDSLRATLTREQLLEPYVANTNFKHHDIKGWDGLGFPDFEDVAFESAKTSGIIQEYDLEAIQEISKLYKEQQFVSELSKSMLNKILDINSTSTTQDLVGLIELLTTDFVNGERGLYNSYGELLYKN